MAFLNLDIPGLENGPEIAIHSEMLQNDFLANVNSRSRSLYAIARPSVCRLSVVCNVRAPYSGN